MRYAQAFTISRSGVPFTVGGIVAVFLDSETADAAIEQASLWKGVKATEFEKVPVRIVTGLDGGGDSVRADVLVNLSERDPSDVGIMELARESEAIAKSKGFAGQSVPETMALFHSEISEAFEEWRNGHGVHEIYEKDGKPEGYPIELADLQIRLAHHVAEQKIDLVGAVRRKSTYNRSRPFRHGGKKV